MLRFVRALRGAPTKLLAVGAAAAALVSGGAQQAHAQPGIGAMANNVSTQFTGITNLLLNGALLVGLGFSGAGLMKLKQASDDGGQRVKYGEGIWRLGVGGGLAALPFIAQVMKGTVDGGNAGALQGTGAVTFR